MNKVFKSLKLGIIKAYHIPNLPENVYNFYNHIFMRIFRVIGGLCVYFTFFNKLTDVKIVKYIILVIAIIQLTLIFIITMYKIVYSIKKLINNPEEFEVRNSPLPAGLDILASKLSKFVYCWTLGCNAVVSTSTVMPAAIGASYGAKRDS